MTIKQFWINLKNPKNWVNFVRGNFKKFVIWITGQNKIYKAMWAVYTCPDCYRNNTCKECGCDFDAVVLSNKTCPKHK